MNYIVSLLFLLLFSFSVEAKSSLQGETIHLYDVTYGFVPDSDTNIITCAPAGTEVYVVSDDGVASIVSITSIKAASGNKTTMLASAWCGHRVVAVDHLYSIQDKELVGGKFTSKAIVTGILAVPFKWHLSDKSLTFGSTVGGYIGYQTSFANVFTITPIIGGGLALINTTPVGSTVSSTNGGFSLATGLIGTSNSLQYGIVVGVDWLGSRASYTYEGKPWLALEVGFALGQ